MNIEGGTVPDAIEDDVQGEKSEATPIDPKDEEIQRLTLERDQLKDQILRVMAEAQNVQRRLRQQMDEDRKFSAQPLVERLLPVVDSFERSLLAAEKGASLESLLEGVRVIDKQLRQALETVSVRKIESVGSPYRPDLHEAILVLESSEHPEETITEEIESGYTMHGRVVRPAKVRVTKKP